MSRFDYEFVKGLTMKLSKYEINSLKEIEKWEKAKHGGFHKKILDVTSKPVDYLIKKRCFCVGSKSIGGAY